MIKIHIDIETYSSADLSKCGVYKYAEATDFSILLFSYSIDDGPVQIIDLACGEMIPAEIISALSDPSVIKWAFNAAFERVCISRYLGLPTGSYLDPAQWRCSMVWAATLGLPLSLSGVGEVLSLDKQKLAEGRDLIDLFCKPCISETGECVKNDPLGYPEKWIVFKRYNARDVDVEMSIQTRLAPFPVSARIWNEYSLDQQINDRGIAVDTELVKRAVILHERCRMQLISNLKALTHLENPASAAQMKTWLGENGLKAESLCKKDVEYFLKSASPSLRKILTLWQQLSKSSVKKYQAIDAAVCADGRVRGMFAFYGAARTGRWAGRLAQLQNLPQNHLPDLCNARTLLKHDPDAFELKFDDTLNALSQLIRTAFVPKPGTRLIVSDYSAIEARVIVWLAGEEWRQAVFANGGGIYCASAAKMFKVPVEKNGINSNLRQKGKVAELALGYGGSVGALKAMGALENGLSERELQPLVDAWRQANPKIVKLWWDVDHAAIEAVCHRHTQVTHGISFSYISGILFVKLPSGRSLAYAKPRIGENKFGGPCIVYEGIGVDKKWRLINTYGPKLVENIVQAISRDLLAFAMNTMKEYSIVMHVHDEIVLEAGPETSLKSICDLMSITPPWANGLLLKSEGYETDFYRKD